jgi:hypothetical protein
MTTLIIEIPDDNMSILSKLTSITKDAGLKITIDTDEDNLSESEFKSLQDACNEAVLIKKGLSKGILPSELWND